MMSRRDALKTAGAVAMGSALASTGASAQESAVKNARLKQSVCRWCYQRIPLEDFFKGVAAIGLKAVDLLQPEEWDVAAKYGLQCSTGYPGQGGGTIPDGLNNPALHDQIAAFHRHRRQEDAVGQIFEVVEVPADTDFALDRVVVRREVRVVDRPVFAGALERPPLEIALAEAERHGVPQHGLPAHAAGALGIEAGLAGPHGGYVPVRVVERHRVGIEVGPRVHARPAFHDRDARAAPGEMRGERAAARARSHDHDIEFGPLHVSQPQAGGHAGRKRLPFQPFSSSAGRALMCASANAHPSASSAIALSVAR